MRLAIHPTGEVGRRAARILLAEADLAALGIYGAPGARSEERRATAVTSLEGYAVLASDDALAPLDLAAIAVADGLSCALAADTDPPPHLVERFAARGLTLLVAASLPGLAEALAHRAEDGSAPDTVLLAWTRPGKPGRRDLAVPFPPPVGARWGTRILPRSGDPAGTTRVEVPYDGPWAGALARLTMAGTGRKPTQRLVAVADDRRHLEAIALAAGTLLLARGGAPPGACRPGAVGPAYLAACLGVGLEVAGLGGTD